MQSASNQSAGPARARSLRRAAVLAGVLLLAVPSTPFAHEIPASVMIRAFVKPEGRRLRLVVRVPLEAMRDVQFPLRGPGYLELGKLEPLLRDGARIWIADNVQLYEGDTRLSDARIVSTRVSLPSDRSFGAYDSAVAHVTGPTLPDDIDLAWQQAMLDVLFEYDITSDSSRFSINPALARLGVRTTTVLHFLPPGGTERAYQYTGDPGLVRLDPR